FGDRRRRRPARSAGRGSRQRDSSETSARSEETGREAQQKAQSQRRSEDPVAANFDRPPAADAKHPSGHVAVAAGSQRKGQIGDAGQQHKNYGPAEQRS